MSQMAGDVAALKKHVLGNGQPQNSILSRLDRVERWVAASNRLLWIVAGAIVVWAARGVWVASVVYSG